MRKLTATLCLIIAVLLGSTGMSASADFQKGLTAYKRGDFATALREWKPLAEQGNVNAQFNLGFMYRGGHGVSQNYETAAKWWKFAAEQGDAPSQLMLGAMYEEGTGVPQDYKTAVKWLKLSAKQGNAAAQYKLGVKYLRGNGVEADDIYAYMWMEIASLSGEKIAAKNRDIMASWMTPADISTAQKLARECVRKKYKKC